jgi:putative two-component system response regulator
MKACADPRRGEWTLPWRTEEGPEKTMADARTDARVLVVDDDQAIRDLMMRLLGREGYHVTVAPDGPTALAAIADAPPDVILLDVVLPGMSGFDICRAVKSDRRTRLTPVVLITGLGDREHRLEGLAVGADDFLTKPVDAQEMLIRVRSLLRMKRYTDELDSAATIITSLALLIEGRDGREGHCHRMANYATALGRQIGLADDDLQALHRGGFLHDIGMLVIPDAVLRKTGPLTQDEFELVKSHTVAGDGLCAPLKSLQSVRPIIRHHHERFDGSGYPDGLRGNDIPLVAQIMGLVDVYDAITTKRAYQGAKPSEEAIDVLRGQAQRGWRRADLVESFAALVDSGRLDTFQPAAS